MLCLPLIAMIVSKSISGLCVDLTVFGHCVSRSGHGCICRSSPAGSQLLVPQRR